MSQPIPAPLPDALVLYDGVCRFCTWSVQFIIQRDPSARIHFAALQSELGRRLCTQAGQDPDDATTFLFLHRGQLLDRSTAALKVASLLTPPWSWLRHLIHLPRPLLDAAYILIAKNRYRLLGKKGLGTAEFPALETALVDLPRLRPPGSEHGRGCGEKPHAE
jgi:predicted DCC family thiol-disulfide oxidoreductase YuxK